MGGNCEKGTKLKLKIIGVYSVASSPHVHLIELETELSISEINFLSFTQEVLGKIKLDWQVPWDEKILNKDGSKIIREDFEDTKPRLLKNRIIFFFHYLDFEKPFLTPLGEITLPLPKEMPKRLKSIIKYTNPD